jgi:CTP:molybdopterin cytidylyltransferase MocA
VKPAGIILAAGESSRMGRDKALLPYLGSTFLNRLISLYLPRVEALVVVLGHHADEIRASLPAAQGLSTITNPDYKRGMLSSLQTGLGAVGDAPAVLFTLVDHPAVRAQTIDRLIEEFFRDHPAVAIPRYGERRGHPVVLSRRIADEILALPPARSAKEVIRARSGETLFVDVDDAGVLRDIDLPADYEALLRDREETDR